MFRRNIAQPVIRQFILRTAVLNFLSKSLKQQWNDLRQLIALLVQSEEYQKDEAQLVEVLELKVAASHRLLKREYDELFIYMMDKRDLWDSPEYFKAKAALGSAIHNLRTCAPTKTMDEGQP
ncbi:uncharacterized protein LOC128263922 [Drosophila gunungcola]|uniref:Uncharacterized protein n=1 Tax=Drosophila gunungcola TaxID=103775 RepID=A0A9P9YWG3_9MUSC|nr:uncharacterized protein LOC128263922 [Drosophila gunungcola]KAI8044352.1 hypothetical protein M5D96_000508 [Drosophila gunungcola]